MWMGRSLSFSGGTSAGEAEFAIGFCRSLLLWSSRSAPGERRFVNFAFVVVPWALAFARVTIVQRV